MHSILQWVIYDSTAVMQSLLFVAFVLVSAAVEYRRTGLILAGFAAFYLGLIPLNGLMNELSPPAYALFYATMDFAAMWAVFLYGQKGSRAQAVILGAFVITHIMAWAYASGLPSVLDPQHYGVLTFCLNILVLAMTSPGIRRGVYEALEMAREVLADHIQQHRYRVAYHSGHDSDPLSIRGDCDPARWGDGGVCLQRDFPPGRLAGEEIQ